MSLADIEAISLVVQKGFQDHPHLGGFCFLFGKVVR